MSADKMQYGISWKGLCSIWTTLLHCIQAAKVAWDVIILTLQDSTCMESRSDRVLRQKLCLLPKQITYLSDHLEVPCFMASSGGVISGGYAACRQPTMLLMLQHGRQPQVSSSCCASVFCKLFDACRQRRMPGMCFGQGASCTRSTFWSTNGTSSLRASCSWSLPTCSCSARPQARRSTRGPSLRR